VTHTRRRLIDSDYTATQDSLCEEDGWSIMKRWERTCRDFIESLPSDVELTDIAYLCEGKLITELSRRIIRERAAATGKVSL